MLKSHDCKITNVIDAVSFTSISKGQVCFHNLLCLRVPQLILEGIILTADLGYHLCIAARREVNDSLYKFVSLRDTFCITLLIIDNHLVDDLRYSVDNMYHRRPHLEGLRDFLISQFLVSLLKFLRIQVGCIGIARQSTSGTELEVTVRLNGKGTLLRLPVHFDERTDEREIDHALHHAGQLLGNHCLHIIHKAEDIERSSVTVCRGKLVPDVSARSECQVVACFDGYVLTFDTDVAVGGIDRDACKSIDRHGTPGRADVNGTLIGRAADFPDAILVAQIHTAFEAFAHLAVAKDIGHINEAIGEAQARGEVGHKGCGALACALVYLNIFTIGRLQ